MRKPLGMFLLIGFGSALLVLSCNQQQKPTFDVTAMKKIIEEKNNQFTQAHITGDTTFLNNIFTRDGKAFPPNSDAVIGRSAIAAVNSQYVQFGIKEFREETTAFYGNEDFLIDEGTYYIRYGRDDTIDKGKYLNVWKKEDGDWKLYSNIWNTSMPATPTK
jgi:ketosteroid isomerase-like protein